MAARVVLKRQADAASGPVVGGWPSLLIRILVLLAMHDAAVSQHKLFADFIMITADCQNTVEVAGCLDNASSTEPHVSIKDHRERP